MKKYNQKYDINAHIEDIMCDVVTENGDSVAVVSFSNLGYGDITAVKFNATGYNSFGDLVPVSNKEKFFLIIQDIMIKKNEKAENLKARLPVSDIKKLDIEEVQICFANGSVTTYEGKHEIEIELDEFDTPEQIALNAVHKLYDEKIRYQICECSDGWVCGCGRYNQPNSTFCTLCGKDKVKTKAVLSPEGLEKLVEEYHIKIKEEQEAMQLKSIADKKANKQKKIRIAIGVVVGIILAIIVGNAIIMSGRTTYDTEAEMKTALQGKYTYYDGYKAMRQIEIKGDQFRYIYRYTDSENWMDIDWYPNQGKIHTFEDIIVTSDGDLKVDGELYEKGGYMSTESGYTNSYSSESGYSVLKITVDNLSSNSSYTICTGSVKNTGKKTYYYVEVKGSFKDSSGNVLDTDWTYAAGSEGLAPGESTTFRLSVPKDYDIQSCSVSLLDFD